MAVPLPTQLHCSLFGDGFFNIISGGLQFVIVSFETFQTSACPLTSSLVKFNQTFFFVKHMGGTGRDSS